MISFKRKKGGSNRDKSDEIVCPLTRTTTPQLQQRERERERERCEELYYITMEEKWDIMATFFKIWFPT
jgi:hypothetical protein